MLVFLLLSPAAATAADTRDILIGSPGALDGELTFTPTGPGGLTAVDVTVTNNGGQTINSVRLLGGDAADAAPVNPLFPAPTYDSLPVDAKYVATYPSCGLPAAGATTLTCDLGTLRKGKSATYRIIIETPSTPAAGGSFDAWFGAYVAEGNATGTNQDNFYAEGSFTTSAATCEAGKNANANYFLPGFNVQVTSAGCDGTETGGQRQNASITSGGALSGQGGFASLQVEDSFDADCPTSVRGVTGCYGNTVAVSALAGANVPGGLRWEITWYGTRSLAGVVHFLDGDVGYDTIFFNRKSQCSASLVTECWVETEASKGNADPLWFRAVFITEDNGKGAGFY